MNRKITLLIVVSIVTLAMLVGAVVVLAQAAKSTAASGVPPTITVQGRLLRTDGSPVTSQCNLTFGLYDAQSGPTQIGGYQTISSVPITNGLFTVGIDSGNQFGGSAFDGSDRWLGISAQCVGDSSPITLTRLHLTATPYAIYALNSASTQALQSQAVTTTLPTTGQVLKFDGSTWAPGVDNTGSGGNPWLLTGNAGTNPNTNFLGTTDNMTFSLRVSNTAALRLAPTDETPNLIGGFISNTIGGSTNHGSAIGGGGSPQYGANTIQGGDTSYSTIGGGVGNIISGATVYNSVIGGGAGNVISGSLARRSTIGGGWSNTASYQFVTIGGGAFNDASNTNASIGGGWDNNANGNASTIAGGSTNTANGAGAFIGGGGYDGSGTIGNQASGNASSITGGYGNVASGAYATIPGGYQNEATLTDTFAAGNQAQALHQGTFVWADSTDAAFVSTGNDQFLIRAAGGVGIGTNNPNAALDVSGTIRTNKTVTAYGGFAGQCLTNASPVFQANPSRTCNMDVAEGFASTELTAPGDLVTLVTSASNAPTVRKSSSAYDGLLIGVVSQNPGLIFDNGQTHLAGDNSKLITADKTVVALVGRVQVKVSMENGFIAIGDPLTSSSTPGVAMKATRAGKIVGYAMGIANANGTVLALVQPGYYLPSDQLATQTDSAPTFNWFNLLSVIAFAGFATMWLQQRRSKRGQA